MTMADNVDPLDAYMLSIQDELKQNTFSPKVEKLDNTAAIVGQNTLFTDFSDHEDEKGAPGSTNALPEANFETVEDLLAYAQRQARKKDLVLVDHSQIKYAPFRKAFYTESPEIRRMTEQEVKILRAELNNIKIRGLKCPKPIRKWTQCGLSSKTLDVIRECGYEKPTPIQAQAIPAIMSGRDIIGIAKTGSGKTIAFLLPMLRHALDQPPVHSGDGPIVLIMTPTRELAMQIYFECRKFALQLRLRVVCVYGGAPIKDQIADLKKGAEIVISTPGRMIDLLVTSSGNVTNLQRVTFLVLDEADRMFDMGFGPQITKIVDNIRPDRQVVLFSATFPRSMEALAKQILVKPLEILVGLKSVVCEDITQQVEVMDNEERFLRLLEILGEWYPKKTKRILVFVSRQDTADELLRDLMRKGYPCMSLHGGRDQADRDTAISDFKSGVVPVLIATSVAARGLDVKDLGLVINYECPNHMEDYVHRVGRTGRAGKKGTAITFITYEQERYAPDILRALVSSKAHVPEKLQRLCDEFVEKVRKGVAHVTSSGFGGKGLERFEQDRMHQKRAQKMVHAADEELSEEDLEVKEKAAANREAFSKDVISKPLFEGKIESTSPPVTKKPSLTIETQTALRQAKQMAAQITQKVVASGGNMEVKLPGNAVAGRLFGKALFEALARGDIVPIYDPTIPIPPGGEPIPKSYICEVVVNDFSQFVRFTICNKETVQMISEMSGANVLVRGSYIPPGKPQTDRPLFLHIEAESQHAVEIAKREILRTLRELLAVDGKSAGTGLELAL